MSHPHRRLLIVIANGGRGGMQSQVRLIAGELARRGHAVTLAVGPGEFAPVDGTVLVRLPALSSRHPLRFRRALRRVVRVVQPDITHGHGLRLAPFFRWARVPRPVVTCHGIDPERARRTIDAVRYSAVPVVACGEGPRLLLASHGLTSRVINNALGESPEPRTRDELLRTFDLSGARPIVVLPARYSEQKNHVQLLSALRAVRLTLGDDSPDVVCVGDGPLFAEIAADARVPGERPLVECRPFAPNAGAWLAASDFFILPSRWEGQPLVVLEALAAGLSVVSSTPTGVEDLVIDGVNGRRVSGPAGLADTIVEWCRDPSSRPFDDTSTRELLAQHSLGVVADAHEQLYAELVGGGDEPASAVRVAG